MARAIRNDNTSLLKHSTSTNMKECAGRQKTECPLDKKCLSGYLMYNTLVDRLDASKTKYSDGTCEKNFKERYNNHTASFRNQNKEKSTVLPKYIWKLKDNNMQHNLKWCIASKAHPYVCGSSKCDLSFTEKLTIIKSHPETLLNTGDELVSKCRHMTKFILRRIKKN